MDQFTINLTERAKKGEIDPVIGREAEVRQMVDILIRRRQNNPILTGEAGVGKTAVVEGLARRIAQGDVPPPLKNVVLRTLDLGLLQAGAGVKGEFENRLKQVIAEVKASPVPIILFIDEAHTMIGAGGQAGQGDAANLLKPALARGELPHHRRHHLGRIQEVLREGRRPRPAVPGRQGRGARRGPRHPDDARDHRRSWRSTTACASSTRPSRAPSSSRIATSRPGSCPTSPSACSTPPAPAWRSARTPSRPAVEDCRRQIDHLKVEIEHPRPREAPPARKHDERIDELNHELDAGPDPACRPGDALGGREEARRGDPRARRAIEARYTEEQGKHAGNGQPVPALRGTGRDARPSWQPRSQTLRKLQGESPLMQVSVDSQTIAEVVAGWTGIPVGKMLANEIQTVLNLRSKLEERVIGQSHALEAIGQRIRTARASLTDPRRPIGVFLLVGPSGVGKTETALALADTLYGGERNLITINMSEYQEAHTVSGLKGSPPGYVGYGEGGVLTEAVRRRPYSVVLLDEVEKAHPDVLELFFQVFDKGTLEDGEGREIDFKNTVILLTSNVGTDTILKLCKDPDTTPTPEVLAEAIRPDLLAAKTERGVQIFKQAFLGRLIVVPYYPISDAVMRQIIRLQLGRIGRRMRENHNATFSYGDELDRLHRQPLSRSRERRTQRRPHPHPHPPPRDLPGNPGPDGGKPDHLQGPCLGRRQGRVPLRDRLSRNDARHSDLTPLECRPHRGPTCG